MNESKTIFLTGATGRTGREVLRLLIKLGHSVRCLVRTGPDHRASNLLASFEHPKFEPVLGDLRETESKTEPDTHSGTEGPEASAAIPGWAPALAGCHAAIHIAGIALVGDVVAACQKYEVGHLICVSSTRRFTSFPDPTADRVIQNEDLIEQSGLSATILQATMIYGGGRDQNVARLAGWINRRRWMPLVAGGAGLIQPIHAHDVAAAIILRLENELNSGKTAPESTTGDIDDPTDLGAPSGTSIVPSLVTSLVIAGPQAMTWRAMIESIASSAGTKVRFISIPAGAAAQLASALETLNISRPVSPAEIRRQFEDRDFDIAPALAALPGWRPRPFDPKG